MRMGASAGLTFRYVGLDRKLDGRSARAALIAACKSRAAPLMSRLSPNCSVIRVAPTLLDEGISVTSAICPRWRSSGVATLVATTARLAPVRCAPTEIVGEATSGRGG